MEHIHPVIDDDPHFIIDTSTRYITYTGEDKLVLIQGDHNSERFSFKMPRIVDGHDMMLCNRVQVHYVNINGEIPDVSSADVYTVDDLAVSEDDEDTITWTWLISQTATMHVGTLNFALRFSCVEDSKVTYVWNTAPYSGIIISNGISSAETLVVQYGDVLDKWYDEFMTAGGTGVRMVNEAVDAAIETVTTESIKNVTAHALTASDILVQGKGNSDERIMSQKAVSQELDEIEETVREETQSAVNDVRALKTELEQSFANAIPFEKIEQEPNGLFFVDYGLGQKYKVYGTKNLDGSWPVNLEVWANDDKTSFVRFNIPPNPYNEFVIISNIRVLVGNPDADGEHLVTVNYKVDGMWKEETGYVKNCKGETLWINGADAVYLINHEGEYVVNANGIADIRKTKTSGLTDTYTISLDNGVTKTFDVKNGNGIDDIVLTDQGDYEDTYTVYLTNGTTETFKVPNGGAVGVKKSVSGEIISLSDVSPLKHRVKVNARSKNLIPYPHTDTTKTLNGITFTDNGDGSVSVSGTATAGTAYSVGTRFTLKTTSFHTLSGCPGTGSSSTYMLALNYYSGSTEITGVRDIGKGATFGVSANTDVKIYIYIASGCTVSGLTFYPQLELGSVATEYTPYVDVSGEDCSVFGKNLFVAPSPTTTYGVTLSKIGDYYMLNGTAEESFVFTRSIGYLPAGTYTLSANNPQHNNIGTSALVQVYSSAAKSNIAVLDNAAHGIATAKLATATDYNARIRCEKGVTYNNFVIKPQLEVGDAATEYEAYKDSACITIPAAGIPFVFPSQKSHTTIRPDSPGIILDVEYNVPVKGDSAYDVAVQNGFKGTEAEWLASLKGKDGADGIGTDAEVVQEFGNNPDKVMSQKAVTDAIDGLSLKGTASGKTIRIDDCASGEYPVKVKVTGVDDPATVRVYRSGINALPYPFYNTTKTVNGITFTDNGDGTVTANGTATAQATFTIASRSQYYLPPTTVYISGCPAGGGASTYQVSFAIYNGATFGKSYVEYGTGRSVNLNGETYDGCIFYCIVNAGATVSNLVFKPMVEIGTPMGEYTPFVAYDNYIPNSDGTVSDVGSVGPMTVITTDNPNATLECEYIRDIESALNAEEVSGLVVLTKIGDSIQFRSGFGENDIAIRASMYGSHNKSFNFEGYYILPTSIDYNDVASGTLFKTASDDITPIYINDSYRGGNHGDSHIYSLTFTSTHGLSEVNIGETWTDSTGTDYVVLQVPSGKILVVGAYNESTMQFTPQTPAEPLIKGSNSISWSSVTSTQLRPAANNISVKIYNDAGTEITDNGIYGGKYFDVSVSYDVPTVQATVAYLKAHIGTNTNLSCGSDDISSKYCTVNNVYRFTERGAVTEYQTVDWYCTTYARVGFVQSSKIGDYYCVPHTSKYSITSYGSTGANIDKSTWNDAGYPPDRFYQFVDQDASAGFCVGYNTECGDAIPAARKNLTRAMRYETTGKMYPYLKDGNVDTGSSLSAICYRTPIGSYDDDISAVSWYYIGEDIYVLVDVQKTVNKYLALPGYMNGRKVSIVKTSGNITIPSQFTTAQGLKIVVDTYGSAVIRLTGSKDISVDDTTEEAVQAQPVQFVKNYELDEGQVIDRLDNLADWKFNKYPLGDANPSEVVEETTITKYGKALKFKGRVASGQTNMYKTVAYDFTSVKKTFSLWVYFDKVYENCSIRLKLYTGAYGSSNSAIATIYTNTSPKGWNLLAFDESKFVIKNAFDWANVQCICVCAETNSATDSFTAIITDLRVGKAWSPKIIFRFDDGLKGVYQNAEPALRARGMSGVVYCNTAFTERADDSSIIDPVTNKPYCEGYCTTAELMEMYNNGFDIANHSRSHFVFVNEDARYDYSDVDEASEKTKSILYQIRSSQNWLINKGFVKSARHFAVPGGHDTELCQQALIDCGVLTSGNSVHDDFIPNNNPHKVPAWGIANTTTLDQIKEWISDAVLRGRTVALMFHDVLDELKDLADGGYSEIRYQYLTADFEALLDWIVAQGWADYVTNMSDWYEGLNRNNS